MSLERDIDTRIAQEIFGFQVFAKNNVLHETAENGDRPLKPYSKEMNCAWIVAEKMRVSIIPIEDGNWFAFIGPQTGWSNPEAFLEFLRNGDFSQCGASVGSNPAQVICEAALVANQKQKAQVLPEAAPISRKEDTTIH